MRCGASAASQPSSRVVRELPSCFDLKAEGNPEGIKGLVTKAARTCETPEPTRTARGCLVTAKASDRSPRSISLLARRVKRNWGERRMVRSAALELESQGSQEWVPSGGLIGQNIEGKRCRVNELALCSGLRWEQVMEHQQTPYPRPSRRKKVHSHVVRLP